MNSGDYLEAYAYGARRQALSLSTDLTDPIRLQRSTMINERPNEPLPDHPPVPDNAPYIGDVVQGSTSVPLPSTYTGDVDPAQIAAPLKGGSGEVPAVRQADGFYWYYVRIDQGWNVPVRETIMTSSVDIDTLTRSIEQDQAKLDIFKGTLIHSLRIDPALNTRVDWESLPTMLESARPHRFMPPPSIL